MATTDDNKLRSIAGILGVSSLALFGVTACDDGAGADDPAEENGVEEENGVDDGLEEEDDGMDDMEEEDDAEG